MDMAFSEQDMAFAGEVRDFIAENYTPDLQEKSKKSLTGYIDKEGQTQWQKALYKKGWAATRWPTELGGADFTPTQQYLFDSEMAKAGAPGILPFGVRMLAPVLMAFGSDEQKEKFLPRILRFDDWWCQGYSEPGSGSDLASLSTRAVRDGDDYVVNGSKIWTTKAQDADWIFCLVRTSTEGKRQEGISFLLIDMKSPGITVEPIVLLDNTGDGLQEVNQVFFEDVRVPVENRVGEENKGWTYAKYLLEFERGGSYSARLKANLNRLKDFAKQEKASGARLIDDDAFRTRLAQIETEIQSVEISELRILSEINKTGRPGPESSILKLRGSELIQAVGELGVQAVGYYGQPYDTEWLPYGSNMESIGPGHAPTATLRYMNQRKVTIYGGSSEVQHMVIAKHILGL